MDERKYLGQQQRLCHLSDLMHLKVLQAQVEKISREYKDSCSDLEGERTARPIASLPDRLRAVQATFAATGGLHATGLFSADGTLRCAREDVGRHNAMDKVLGWALLDGRIPAAGTVLMVSGRASFELVQKAVMAGVPALAAVSAPSSLAVELALDAGLTLVGFLRGPTMNVYAGAQRIVVSEVVAGA